MLFVLNVLNAKFNKLTHCWQANAPNGLLHDCVFKLSDHMLNLMVFFADMFYPLPKADFAIHSGYSACFTFGLQPWFSPSLASQLTPHWIISTEHNWECC